MSNKEKAIGFLKLAGTGQVKEAYDKFVALEFRHHNQYFKGDRQSLLVAMETAAKNAPNKSIETKFVYEDGPTVIAHSHVTRVNADQAEVAVVHIMKFENEKITELWDIGQLIDKNSPNENGMF